MNQEYPKFFFWIGLIMKFFSRYYLALPAFLFLLLGLGSITCFLIGLALFAVNFGIAFFEQRKMQKSYEQSMHDPQLKAMRTMFMGKPFQSTTPPHTENPDVIDVDATEITIENDPYKQ